MSLTSKWILYFVVTLRQYLGGEVWWNLLPLALFCKRRIFEVECGNRLTQGAQVHREVNAGNQRLKMLLEQAQKAKDSNYSLSFLALSGLIIIIVQGNLWNKMEHNLHLLLQCFHLPFCFPFFNVLCLFVLLFSLVLAPCIPKGF